jgi:uncharacterized protein (TIGR02996 family)
MDEAELLSAIDDPGVRAVYADWLEQQGDPRAELVQIAYDLWKEPIDLLRVRRMVARRRELAHVGDAVWRRRITLPTIAELRRRVGVLAGFGRKKEHAWNLRAPLDADKLAAVEARLGVALPAQYRQYLAELSDGGAGPELGVEPIDSALRSWVAGPFPSADKLSELDMDDLPGVLGIGIGDYTTRYWLVCTGPDAGVVWMSTDNGWTPMRADGSWASTIEEQQQIPRAERAEFLDWYASWLDETLWDIANDTPDRDDLFDREPSEVVDVNLEGRDFSVLPEKLRQMTRIKRLSLEGTPITELPPWICELQELAQLILGKTALRTLPDEICELPALRWLSCFSAKSLERLPAAIGRLPLTYLNLQYCGLVELPSSISDLALEELQINNNRLATLPQSVAAMRLSRLDLRANCITSLPDEFASSGIVELSLMENAMTRLPDTVGRMQKLETLTLDGNGDLDLADACRVLANAPSLRKLSLASMGIERLPDELALLTQIESLSVNFNRVVDIDVLRHLPNLKGLDVVCAGPDGRGSEVSRRWDELRGS